jgi:hypothetical protein
MILDLVRQRIAHYGFDVEATWDGVVHDRPFGIRIDITSKDGVRAYFGVDPEIDKVRKVTAERLIRDVIDPRLAGAMIDAELVRCERDGREYDHRYGETILEGRAKGGV